MTWPKHGLERFKIKIVKKFNMKSDMTIPKFRRRPTPGDLGCSLIGRNVSNKEIEKFLAEYFGNKRFGRSKFKNSIKNLEPFFRKTMNSQPQLE